jgi:hypothetical protein
MLTIEAIAFRLFSGVDNIKTSSLTDDSLTGSINRNNNNRQQQAATITGCNQKLTQNCK